MTTTLTPTAPTKLLRLVEYSFGLDPDCPAFAGFRQFLAELTDLASSGFMIDARLLGLANNVLQAAAKHGALQQVKDLLAIGAGRADDEAMRGVIHALRNAAEGGHGEIVSAIMATGLVPEWEYSTSRGHAVRAGYSRVASLIPYIAP